MSKEIIEEAVTLLEELVDSSRVGVWRLEAVDGAEWAVSSIDGDLIAGDIVYAAEGDLIVAMQSYVKPTLELLKLGLSVDENNPLYGTVLAIAEAVVKSS